MEEIFRSISRIEVEDGIVFQPDSVKAADIRKEANGDMPKVADPALRDAIDQLLTIKRAAMESEYGRQLPIINASSMPN